MTKLTQLDRKMRRSEIVFEMARANPDTIINDKLEQAIKEIIESEYKSRPKYTWSDYFMLCVIPAWIGVMLCISLIWFAVKLKELMP